MERSFELVGAGGRLVLVGHTIGVLEFDNPLFHRRELEVRASRNALRTDWATVLDLVSNANVGRRRRGSAIAPHWTASWSTCPAWSAIEQLLVKAVVDIGPAPVPGEA